MILFSVYIFFAFFPHTQFTLRFGYDDTFLFSLFFPRREKIFSTTMWIHPRASGGRNGIFISFLFSASLPAIVLTTFVIFPLRLDISQKNERSRHWTSLNDKESQKLRQARRDGGKRGEIKVFMRIGEDDDGWAAERAKREEKKMLHEAESRPFWGEKQEKKVEILMTTRIFRSLLRHLNRA